MGHYDPYAPHRSGKAILPLKTIYRKRCVFEEVQNRFISRPEPAVEKRPGVTFLYEKALQPVLEFSIIA